MDGPPILPTDLVGAQCCCQLALSIPCPIKNYIIKVYLPPVNEVLEHRGQRQAAHVLPSIGDAPLPGRVDCGWAHGAPIDVEARVHVGISVLALFAHHSCEPLFAGSNQTPATVVTINNITYLEGRGFLPHHPLHQQVWRND